MARNFGAQKKLFTLQQEAFQPSTSQLRFWRLCSYPHVRHHRSVGFAHYSAVRDTGVKPHQIEWQSRMPFPHHLSISLLMNSCQFASES
jgi:hypothetical protein